METKKVNKLTSENMILFFGGLFLYFCASLILFRFHLFTEEDRIIAKNTSFFALYKVFLSLATAMFVTPILIHVFNVSFIPSKYKTDGISFLFKRSEYYFLRTLIPLCLACLFYYLNGCYKPDLAQFSSNVIEEESIFMQLFELLLEVAILFGIIAYFLNLRKTRNGFLELSPNYISWSEDGKLITKINKKEIKEIKIIRSSRTQEIENYQIVKDEMFLLNLEDLRLQVFSEIINSKLQQYFKDLIIDTQLKNK